MEYEISVIIPCYNAEKSIERAINSVIKQTFGFENIELLLYDDASTDRTPSIIRQYCERYSNIVGIFSDENSGMPGKGRNTCIMRSSAPFIMFMDNDDEYEENICKILYDKITAEDYDLVSCGFINSADGITDSRVIFNHLPGKAQENENEVIFTRPNIFYYNNIMIWNSIFKKDIIVENNIRFPERNFGEDICFSMIYKLQVNRLCYLKNYFGYLRHVRNDSLSNSHTLDELNSLLDVEIKLAKILSKYDVDLAYAFKGHAAYLLSSLYSLHTDKPTGELIKFLKRIRRFELELRIDYRHGFLTDVLNSLIIHERYRIAVVYIRLLGMFHKSKTIKKIYRRLIIR